MYRYFKGDKSMFDYDSGFLNLSGDDISNALDYLSELFSSVDYDSFTTNIANKVYYDTKEEDDKYLITMPLPGVVSTDISINFKVDTKKNLTVNIANDSQYVKKSDYIIPLKDNVNSDSITSTFSNGVLTITVPKKEVEKKTIEIKVV